jgi:hypothetical protein
MEFVYSERIQDGMYDESGGVNADGGGKRRGAYQRGWHMIRRYMKAVVRFREKLLVLVHITPSCSVSGTLTRRADDIGTSSSRTDTWTSSGRMSSSPKKPLNKKGRVRRLWKVTGRKDRMIKRRNQE